MDANPKHHKLEITIKSDNGVPRKSQVFSVKLVLLTEINVIISLKYLFNHSNIGHC